MSIPRKTRPRAVNPARKKRNHDRSYGEKAGWIRGEACCACGHIGKIEAAHTASGGTGRKADASTLVPLCGVRWEGMAFVPGCHHHLHQHGITTFEKKHKIDLTKLAKQYEAKWQAPHKEK